MTDIKSERCGSSARQIQSRKRNPWSAWRIHPHIAATTGYLHFHVQNTMLQKERFLICKSRAFSKSEVAFINKEMYKNTKYCKSKHKIQFILDPISKEVKTAVFFRESSTKWSWIEDREDPLVTRKMKIKNKKIQSRTPYTPSGHNTVA